MFGTVRIAYNVCVIVYFIAPWSPKAPVVFFGALLDPVSSIFGKLFITLQVLEYEENEDEK